MSNFNSRYVAFSMPFIDSLKKVYEVQVNHPIKPLKPKLTKGEGALLDYTCTMNISGDFEDKKIQGRLLVTWTEDCYLKTLSKLLGEEFKEVNSENEDGGREILNIAMGNAKAELVKVGYKLDMTIPESLAGKNTQIKDREDNSAVHIDLNCDLGEMFMEISYSEV